MSSSEPPPPKLPDYLERVASGTETRPPPRRTPWKAIGAAAVVVIIIVAVIFVAGIFPGASGSLGATPAFRDASQASNSAAGGYQGGGWSLLAGLAFATFNATQLTASEIESAIGAGMCTVSWNPSAPTVISVPATPANAADGGASLWLFLYKNSALALLVVEVENGSALPLFVATGGDCALLASALSPLPAGSIVDSSTAVEASDAKGGAQFLVDHPTANRTWAIVGEVPLLISQPTWVVNYTLCPLPPPTNETVRSVEFNSTVDAQTGAVLTHGTTNTVCSLNLSFSIPSGSLPPPGASHPPVPGPVAAGGRRGDTLSAAGSA